MNDNTGEINDFKAVSVQQIEECLSSALSGLVKQDVKVNIKDIDFCEGVPQKEHSAVMNIIADAPCAFTRRHAEK